MVRATVLRIGHRSFRDARVTTHVGLAARAFGADGLYLAADDPGAVQSIADVVGRWGGTFFVQEGVQWRRCINRWKEKGGIVIHLTMYGQRLSKVIDEIRNYSNVLVVVGAEKVPGDLYGLADYNVSVTTQPHSEISSVAVFLDHLFSSKELDWEYHEAPIQIRDTELRGRK